MIKKVAGLLFLLSGVGIALFVAFNYLFASQEQLSPVPDNDNVRILMLTPQPNK